MYNKVFLIILFLVYLGIAQERPGSTSAQFLKMDVSPRAAGLGGAYIALSEGAESAHYNPAMIAEIDGWDMVFNHNSWFAGIKHEYISIAHHFGVVGAFALSVNGLYTDEMKVRTPLQPDGTGETFYAGAYQIGISYARKMTSHVSLGGSVNYVKVALYDEFNENSFTFDVSVNYNTGYRGHRFALAIVNFGGNIRFVNEDYPMPTNFIFGMSINGLERDNYKVVLSAAGQKPNDLDPLGQGGVELNFMDALFLRGGYVFGHDVARYSFGAGIRTTLTTNLGVRADYAYSDFSELGVSHRIGLGISL